MSRSRRRCESSSESCLRGTLPHRTQGILGGGDQLEPDCQLREDLETRRRERMNGGRSEHLTRLFRLISHYWWGWVREAHWQRRFGVCVLEPGCPARSAGMPISKCCCAPPPSPRCLPQLNAFTESHYNPFNGAPCVWVIPQLKLFVP